MGAVPGDRWAGWGSGLGGRLGTPRMAGRRQIFLDEAGVQTSRVRAAPETAGQLQLPGPHTPQSQGHGLGPPLPGCEPRRLCKVEGTRLGPRGDSRAGGQLRGQLWAPGPPCSGRGGQLPRLPRGRIWEGRRGGGHPGSKRMCGAELRAPRAGKPAQSGP